MFKRDFLKFLGLIPVGVMGAAAGAAAFAPKKEPTNPSSMLILQDLEHSPDSTFYFTKIKNSVALSVGEDGHLWIKQNGEWKRVITE